MPIGPLELGILLVILLLIFGPKRLPGLGKQLGTGMREFKDSITGKDKDAGDVEAPADHAQLAASHTASDTALPPAPAATPEAAPKPEPQAEDRPAAGA